MSVSARRPRLTPEAQKAVLREMPKDMPQSLRNMLQAVQPPYTIAEPTYLDQLYWKMREWITGEATELPLPRSPFGANAAAPLENNSDAEPIATP